VTFGAPFKLNSDATTRPQWQPNLSVSPAGTLLATWYDARESASCTKGGATPCYRMWSRKSNDGGVTWLPDDTFSDVVSPLPAQPADPGIQAIYAGDYDYGSALLTKHLTAWMDGRLAISGTQQQDAFTDRELVGFAVTSTDPACGSVINTQPTDFIVNLSDAVDPTTVQAGDFHGERDSGGLVYVKQWRYDDHLPLQHLTGSEPGRADDEYPCRRISARF
jgi:hypothetical protein